MLRKYFSFLFILFAGCMVGPNYHEPEVCMPTEFEEAQHSEETVGDEDICGWWKQLNDPILDGFLDEARRANYDLRIALEKIEQARAQYRVEKSYLWPEIDFTASASRSRISQNLFPASPLSSKLPGGSFIPVFLDIFQVGFDAIWELDFFGKFRRSKRAAHYTWEATKEDAQSTLILVLSEVAVNYVSIRALQKKIDLTVKKIQADEEALAITRALYQTGLDNQLDVMSLVSTIEGDRATLPVLETSLKQTVYGLAYLLGRQPEGLFDEIKEIRPIPMGTGKVPVGLPSDLLRRRPDVRGAERQLAAATEQIGVVVADLFPHISLTGFSIGAPTRGGSSVGFESAEFNKLLKAPSRYFSIGPAIRWNLLDFGKTRANIAIQNSLQRQALLAYEQTVIASLQDVEGALIAYFEEHKRRNSLAEKVEADRRTLYLTESLFQAGLANEFQVISARKTLLTSESSLVDSEQSLTSDLIALYKAIGGDWDCEPRSEPDNDQIVINQS